ncbi:MAG: hypothetical protein H6619_06265 [Deltaproteobacteria bacterium]|nr:hypothetical protein [Deltaproteobacteria bacterium]
MKITALLSLILLFPITSNAQECANEVTINFNSLAAGTVVSDQFSSSGISLISTLNANSAHPDLALIFDSSNPSGGDLDLGTPNQSNGGPGIGNGANNNTSLGNLLIISEDSTDADSDGLIDNPDDESSGGDIVFNFTKLSQIKELVFVDVESGLTISGFNASNEPTFTSEVSESEDNDVVTINLLNSSEKNNARLVMSLRDSGALASITLCQSNTVINKTVKIRRLCKALKASKRKRIGKRRLIKAGKFIRAVLSKAGKNALRKGTC